MPRFPRPRFTLRTLFVVVTLLAIPCAWVGWQAKIVRDRKAKLAEIEAVVGRGAIFLVTPPSNLPLHRRIFGDEEIEALWLKVSMQTDDIQKLFPEARIYFLPSAERDEIQSFQYNVSD